MELSRHRGGDLYRVPVAAKRVATVAKMAGELASGAGKFWPQRISAGRVTFIAKSLLCARLSFALVAQLDRASDFESEGRRFESVRARQRNQRLERDFLDSCFPENRLGKRMGSTANEKPVLAAPGLLLRVCVRVWCGAAGAIVWRAGTPSFQPTQCARRKRLVRLAVIPGKRRTGASALGRHVLIAPH